MNNELNGNYQPSGKRPPPPPAPPKGIREVRDGLPKRPSTMRWKTGGRIPQGGRLDTEDQNFDSGWRWSPFFVGIYCSSLFWGIMFHLFGG